MPPKKQKRKEKLRKQENIVISNNPVRQNNPTPDSGREPHKQTNPADPQVALTSGESEPPPPKAHCQITCTVEKDWWDKVKPLVEIGGIVLLAIYTIYTIKMYCANKQAADAATSAAVTAHDALTKSTRPWIAVDSFKSLVPPRVIKAKQTNIISVAFSNEITRACFINNA